MIANAPILNVLEVSNVLFDSSIPFSSVPPFSCKELYTMIVSIVRRAVIPIWCRKGRSTNNRWSIHPFDPTLKYIAIGIESSTPKMAARLVAFFQKVQE